MPERKLLLLLTDLSDDARKAYAPTARLADQLGARIELVHVTGDALTPGTAVTLDQPPPVIESDERSKARRAALERECASVGGSEPPRSVLLEGPHVVDEVLAHAERSGAELVALSTHGSGGWKSALLGSVTSKLMRSSRVPLFLVPVRSESTAR